MSNYVFATGALCSPCKWTCPKTGRVQWCWVVDEFTDDSYMNGALFDPQESAESESGLFSYYEGDE